jgi:hypothetical protein
MGLHHSRIHVEQNSYEHVSGANPIKVYTTNGKRRDVKGPKDRPEDHSSYWSQKRSSGITCEVPDNCESLRSMIGSLR